MRRFMVLASLWTLCLPLSGTSLAAPAAAQKVAAPTGHRVVYESDFYRDGNPLIYTLTLENPAPMAISDEPGRHPSISRGGDIFYNRVIQPVWGIITKMYHRQWPLGEEQGVTKNELADEFEPSISRDGQLLAFTSLRYLAPKVGKPMGVIDLLAYKRPFVEQRQLTQNDAIESHPAVDATGTFVYCTQSRGDITEVWRYSYADGKAERLAGIDNGKQTYCQDPTVDGQNRWCAYSSTRDGDSEIYILDLKTMVETRLTTNDANDGEPALTEDGSQIVFVSDRDGDKELFVMARDGSGVRQLTSNDWDDTAPSVQ